MAIRLIESPEPLTAASGQETALLIESDGLRMLRQELRRYCDQKVSGRSFLVAGHRGSGKTTMVQGSIQRTENEINSAWAELGLSRHRTGPEFQSDGRPATILRPLFILLQGPNLLPAENAEQTAARTRSAAQAPVPAPDPAVKAAPEGQTTTPAAGAAPAALAAPATPPAAAPATADPPPNPMETVLVQITLGLYRALAAEFTRAYTERAVSLARHASRIGSKRAKKISSRSLELALQFELELDQYPGVGRLHEYWRLSRSLEAGILFWNGGDPRMDPGQAYRELVALSSTCQAYQRICGKLSRKDEKSQGDKTKVDAEVAMDAKGSELLKPVMALLTGGAVGAGVLAANPSGTPIAVFTGLVTALLASVVVKYSSSRTREEGMNRADLFIPDLSVATLDRVLPVLLNRIRRAGLAPVFVIDELDKVDLTGRITEMVKRLKKLVAENAFFCFLTDRRYFEEMLGRTIDAPYPIEYTYFTNQLFIIFRHRDLHDYLDKVLVVPTPASTSTSTPGTGADSSASTYADRDDKQVLQYILLHDSQMHPIDLRRQLASLRNASGDVNILPGEVRSPRRHYPFAISIQVSIELILDEEEMRAEIEKRPAFLQLAHDTLYYISRRWIDTKLPLDLSDDTGKKCFEDYLRSRMATNTTLGPKLAQVKAEEEIEQERLEKLYLKVDSLTCDYLFDNLRKLATYLAAPGDLAKAVDNSRRIPPVVADALSHEPLLVSIANEPGKYRWTHSATGRLLDKKTGAVAPQSPLPIAEAKWSEDAEVISEFQKQVSELTHRQVDFTALASQFGILKTSPAWVDARRAIERLQQADWSRTPYPEQEDDLRCVHDFRQILTDGSAAMGMSLACALVLSGIQNQSEIWFFWSLMVVAEALNFRRMSPERTLNALRHFVEEFSPFSDMLDPPAVSNKDSVTIWSLWVKKAGEDRYKMSESELELFMMEAWRYWEVRLRDHVLMPEPPKLGTIVCHVLSRGPGAYLTFPVEEMSISSWTWAFYASLVQAGGGNVILEPSLPPIPPWMALAALQHLSFDQSSLNRFFDHLHRFDTTLTPGEFLQQEAASANRRPAGMLICRGRCPSMYWQVSPGQPLLVCTFDTAEKLIRIFDWTQKKLLEPLGLSFVAFDLSRDDIGSSPDAVPANLEAESSSSATKALFLNPEITVYNFFAPDPKAPIPVLIDDPARYPSLDPKYTTVGIKNPAELFAAVSAMVRVLPS